MLNAEVQSMFDDFKPMNEPTIHIRVDFTPGKLVKDLAQIVRTEMIRVAGAAGDRLLADLEAEDIRKYLCTLSFIRRARVMGISNETTRPYNPFRRSAACPVLWYQVLVAMGKALDRNYSVEFYPGIAIDNDDLLDPGRMREISDLMFSLQDNGLNLVAGVPSQEEGELDFMAMSHVEESVLSYRKTHPVYGFLASFFMSQEVSQALGTLVRIKYGVEADYAVQIARVVTSARSTS